MIKPIPWYKLYSISDDWTLYYKWKEKSVSKNRLWYKKASLWTKGMRVHRLVAMTYLWDIEWKVVMHLDDNPSNNCVSNLKIWTQKENIQDMYNKWRNKNYWNKVTIISDDIINTINSWLSKKEIMEKYWVHRNTVLFWKKKLWIDTNKNKYSIDFITNVINYDWNNTQTWKKFWISDVTVMRWKRKYWKWSSSFNNAYCAK